MCAINGITWEDGALVSRMNMKTAHRGPDGTAVAIYSGASFGHNRLAIIDVDPRSNQPMYSGDGRFALVFNGEIYNYKDLRNDLSGYPFKTESDTEVVLAGFSQWGVGVFRRLNGMYALAIYDQETGDVILARDPVGIKPLYIAKTDKGYAFSSEIKALLEVTAKPQLNHRAFNSYLRTLYVPGPATLFEGIEKFPPGTVGIIHNNVLSVQHFSYDARLPLLQAEDSVGLRDSVVAAVQRQMVSDRPLGVYLSGGVDSGAVLASAAVVGGNMNTYTISFALGPGEQPEKFNADAILAKRVAAHFGAQHHEFVIEPREVLSLFAHAAFHLDEPVGNATVAAQVALAKKARESVVVALTGDGGDEVFGGYPRYLMSRRMDLYQQLVPGFVTNMLPARARKFGIKSVTERFALFHFQKDVELAGLTHTSAGPEQLLRLSGAPNLMEADRRTWLVDEALLRSDKLSMAHGVETRPPLLDLELVHQVSRIPFESHVSLFDTKLLLKRAFKKDLPDWLISQPKRGWFSPGSKWLRHPALAAEIDTIFAAGYAPGTDSLFDWNGVRVALAQHRAGQVYRAPALIALLMFQLWSRSFAVEA